MSERSAPATIRHALGQAVGTLGVLADTIRRAFVSELEAELADELPRIEGRVTRSDIQAAWLAGGFYRSRIAVTYEVGGETFTARRVDADGLLGGSFEHALEATLRWPVGTTVEVVYDPRNPRHGFIATRPEHVGAHRAIEGVVAS